MNAHVSIPAPQMPADGVSTNARANPPVSRIGNAAYALEKCAMALLWAPTPAARVIAQREYDGACADMAALLNQFITKDAS